MKRAEGTRGPQYWMVAGGQPLAFLPLLDHPLVPWAGPLPSQVGTRAQWADRQRSQQVANLRLCKVQWGLSTLLELGVCSPLGWNLIFLLIVSLHLQLDFWGTL